MLKITRSADQDLKVTPEGEENQELEGDKVLQGDRV